MALGTMHLDRGLLRMPSISFVAPRRSLLNGLTRHCFSVSRMTCRENATMRGARYATAARARPDSAAIGYARVQHAVASGVEEEISRALLDFKDRHDRVVRPSTPRAQATPFVRLGLLHESPGVAPLFAPALYAEGFRLLNGRRYNEAVAAFQRALDIEGAARDEHVAWRWQRASLGRAS